VKLLDEVAVDDPTNTVMGPVVAPVGTTTVKLFVVAEVTVAAVPLNCTVLLPGVVLKFWPWIVTVVPIPPCDGMKFKIARLLGEATVDREIERILSAAS
jgi:hypothetical protein